MVSSSSGRASSALLRRSARPASARAGPASDAGAAATGSTTVTLAASPVGRAAWAGDGLGGGRKAASGPAPPPPGPASAAAGGAAPPPPSLLSPAARLLAPHLPPCPDTNPFSCAWRGAAGPWAALGGRAYLASPASPPPPVPLPRPGFGRLVPHPRDDAPGPPACVHQPPAPSGPHHALLMQALPSPRLKPLPLVFGGGGRPAAATLLTRRGLAASALVAAPPPPPPPPPLPPPLSPPQDVSGPTADLCDFAISELDDTKSRVASAKAQAAAEAEAVATRTVYAPPSLSSRAGAALKAAGAGLAAAGGFALGAPAKVWTFYTRTPRAERRATYAGWWAAAKAEARHYWAGLKLLGADVRIAGRLVGAAASGRALTRRERRQLTRTVADVFRLVPVAVFLVVPFMEFLLPVALKVR